MGVRADDTLLFDLRRVAVQTRRGDHRVRSKRTELGGEK